MPADQATSFPAAVLGYMPVIITFVLGVASTLVQWLKEFSRDARRFKKWDEAKRALEYWDTHFKLLAALDLNSEVMQVEKRRMRFEVNRIRDW